MNFFPPIFKLRVEKDDLETTLTVLASEYGENDPDCIHLSKTECDPISLAAAEELDHQMYFTSCTKDALLVKTSFSLLKGYKLCDIGRRFMKDYCDWENSSFQDDVAYAKLEAQLPMTITCTEFNIPYSHN